MNQQVFYRLWIAFMLLAAAFVVGIGLSAHAQDVPASTNLTATIIDCTRDKPAAACSTVFDHGTPLTKINTGTAEFVFAPAHRIGKSRVWRLDFEVENISPAAWNLDRVQFSGTLYDGTIISSADPAPTIQALYKHAMRQQAWKVMAGAALVGAMDGATNADQYERDEHSDELSDGANANVGEILAKRSEALDGALTIQTVQPKEKFVGTVYFEQPKPTDKKNPTFLDKTHLAFNGITFVF
jgi:hypothetical protein